MITIECIEEIEKNNDGTSRGVNNGGNYYQPTYKYEITDTSNNRKFLFVNDNRSCGDFGERYSKFLYDPDKKPIYYFHYDQVSRGSSPMECHYTFEYPEIMKFLLENKYIVEDELLSYDFYEEEIEYYTTNKRREFLGLEPLDEPLDRETLQLFETAWDDIRYEIQEQGYFIINNEEPICERFSYLDSLEEIDVHDEDFENFINEKLQERFPSFETDFADIKSQMPENAYPDSAKIYLTDENYEKFSSYEEAYCKLGMKDGWLNEREKETYGRIYPEFLVNDTYEKAAQAVIDAISSAGYYIDDECSVEEKFYYLPEVKDVIYDEEIDLTDFVDQKIHKTFKSLSTDFSHMKVLLGNSSFRPPGIIYLTDENYEKFSSYEEAYCKLGMKDGWLNEREEKEYMEAFPEFFEKAEKKNIR